MIKFVDINTGNLYNGAQPYTHWFPGQQSTNLIYTHKICFLTKEKYAYLNINSEIFNIINAELLPTTNNYNHIEYKDILWNQNIGGLRSVGKRVNNMYAHMIYLSAKSENSGEYTTTIPITVSGNTYNIIIGADFYDEDESLYINLSNMGVELPDAIQKAIYKSNVRESTRDNILMNRKLKELLSNYWDVIANKGNQKSLLNSLKWFEWGDLLELKEVWKLNEFGSQTYHIKELSSILENKYNDTYKEFIKTTYLALYLSMQKIDENEWDGEGNPELYEVVTQWGREDLMMKMCLLGNFYETYFMPIHLDLLHATVENVVFTNTIKIINSNTITRNDYIYQTNSFKCNIQDNQSFVLGNVKCQVGPDTMFGNRWQPGLEYEDMDIFGVDDVAEFSYVSDTEEIIEKDLKQFYSQIFRGVGAIINVECDVDLDTNDFIIESKLLMDGLQLTSNKINKDGHVKFNILFQTEGSHTITLQFRTAGANIYSRTFTINIVDVSGMRLKVCKVNHYLSPEFKNQSSSTLPINMYQFSRCRVNGDYLPVVRYLYTVSGKSDGIALNNILVLRGDHRNDINLKNLYFIEYKQTENEFYTICVCKRFWVAPENYSFFEKLKPYVYRNDYGFFPEFHYLKELYSDDENDYFIKDGDAIAIVPELPLGLVIDEMDWEFFNVTENRSYKFPYISEPFVAPDSEQKMPRGYYDVIFKFRIGNDWHELKLDSAFAKK